MCKVCGAAEAQLTEDCPGAIVSAGECDRVAAGELTYKDGAWTDLSPSCGPFTLTMAQQKQAGVWLRRHQHPDAQGAIGGGITWSFTPTSLGTVEVLSCACGEKLDLTDFANW